MPQIAASIARLRARRSSGDAACVTTTPVRQDDIASATISANFTTTSSRLVWKHHFPILLHVNHRSALRLCVVPGLVELPDLPLPVVGVLAGVIGVVHDAGEAGALPRRGPLQHLPVAVGVAEGEDRPPADEAVDADRLARAVVDELVL